MEETSVELYESFQILWRRKFFIGLVTCGFIVLGALATFLLPPVYETAAVFLITRPKAEVQFTPGNEPKIKTEFVPEISLETYRDLLGDFSLKSEVIQKLGLKDKGDPLAPEALGKRSQVEVVKNTSLIKLKVWGDDPEGVARIANTWAELFLARNASLTNRELSELKEIVSEQLAGARDSLAGAENALRDYREKGRIDFLEMAIAERIRQMVAGESKLGELRIALKNEEATLKEAVSQLEQEDRVLVTSKSIADNPLLSKLGSETTGKSTRELVGIELKDEEVNPNFLRLKQEVSTSRKRISGLRASIEELQSQLPTARAELAELKIALAEESVERERLERKKKTAQDTHQVLAKKNEELRIAGAASLRTVKVASPAYVPTEPSGPVMWKNMALAGVIGLILAMASAFLSEYGEAYKRRRQADGSA